MKKRWLSLALGLALALGLMANAPAASATWSDGPYTLTVNLPEEAADLLPKEGDAKVVVDLYLISKAEDLPAYDAFEFKTLEAGFEELALPEREVLTEEKSAPAAWRELAWAAGAKLLLPGTPAEGDTEGTAPSLAAITPAKMNQPLGEAIPDLKPGLYLVIAHGAGLKPEEYIVSTPGEKEGDPARMETVAFSDDFVYTFQPELAVIPGQLTGEPDEADPAPADQWDPFVEMTLKPKKDNLYGELELVKTVEAGTFNAEEPVTFVFEIKAEKNGKEVYNDVVAMTFTPGQTTDRKKLDRIPAGATVTVTEVYTGASYEVSGEDVKTGTIPVKDALTLTFENEPTPDRKEGHGVINEFTFSTEGKTWDWHAVYPGTYPEGDRTKVPGGSEEG